MSVTKTGAVRKYKNTRQVSWIAVFMFIVIIITCFWIVCGHSILKQMDMSKYLHDRYNENFVVKNIRREVSGLGVSGQLTADAYSDDGTKFEVGEYSNGKMYDMYIKALWSQQASADLSPVKSLFNSSPEDIKFQVYPISRDTKRQDVRSSMYNSKPTLKYMLSSNPSLVHFGIYSIRKGKRSDLTMHQNDVNAALDIIKYIDNTRAGDRNIRYVINVPEDNSNLVCDISWTEYKKLSYEDISKCFVKNRGVEKYE